MSESPHTRQLGVIASVALSLSVWLTAKSMTLTVSPMPLTESVSGSSDLSVCVSVWDTDCVTVTV